MTAPALVAAAALTAALFTARLPPGPDFLLPRRGGYALFQAGWALSASPTARLTFTALVTLALLGALGWLLRSLWRTAKAKRPRGAAAWAGLAAGPAFALLLAWRLRGTTLDLVQLAWFPYGSLDAREPLVAFVLLASVFAAAAGAAGAWAQGRRRTATKLLLALLAGDVVATAAAKAYNVGEPFPLAAGGKTAYVALTEGRDGPGRDVYVLSPGAFGPDPRPEYHRRLAGRRTAHTLPALRALYQAETMRWDEAGLRGALLLGASLGDGLAYSLLLSHVENARPSAEAVAALGALADEDAYRVGPLAAARIARAYARQGEREPALRWAARGSIPPGLLGLEDGGPLSPGRVSGVIKGPAAMRVALYRRLDPAAPYLLDAAAFVAAVDPDRAGRFRFDGLAAGRYYLVAAFPAPSQGLSADVVVAGHRGDVVLDESRRAVVLPAITVALR